MRMLDIEVPALAEARIKVIDKEKLDSILNDLKNIETYVPSGFESTENISVDFNPKFISFNNAGAIRSLTWVEGNQLSKGRFEYKFSNPRAAVYQLLSDEYSKKTNLLNLFATLEYGDSKEKQN